MKRVPLFVLFTAALLLSLAPAAHSDNPPAVPETEIEKTVVTATRHEVSLKDAPGAVSVITAEEIQRMPVRDTTDILRQVAGISLIGRGIGGRKTISIRGLDNRHVLTLIDGRRIAASNAVMGHSDYENAWVPLESIERIEIVRGPLSALYGSEALGGVVNIITRAPTSTWQGGVNLLGGLTDDYHGGETQGYGAHASGPLVKDRVGLSLSAEYRRDEPIEDPDDELVYDIEGQEVSSAGAKLTFTPTSTQRFELYADIVDEQRELRSTDSRGYYETIYDLQKYMIGAGWRGDIGPTRSGINVYRAENDKVSTKTYDATGSSSESPDTVTNDVVDGHITFPVAFNIFTLGGEYRVETVASDTLETVGGEDDATHQAIFLQDEITLLDRLLLTLGVRWDDHEFFGSETSPRLYALYRLTSNLNLKAGYGHAFNAPTIKQVSEGYDAQTGPHRFLGNPDVKPETSENYEAGVEYFGSRITLKAFYFHSDVDDLISWNQIGVAGRTRIFEADNIDSARIRGVETELGVQLLKELNLSTGYTWLDAEDTENDVDLEGRPEHTVSAKLVYTLADWGLQGILRYQYIGEQVYTNDEDELEEVSGYSLWHAALRKTILNKKQVKVDLQAGVENIGDVRLADESILYPFEERGRLFYAKVSTNF